MSDHDKHTAFLKALIHHQNHEAGEGLQQRMKQAQLNERAIKRAVIAVSVLGLLAGCGICYSAVLLPEFFTNRSHLIIKVFSALGLASGICLVGFLGLWAHYRTSLRRLHEECQRLIMGTLKTSAKIALVRPPSVLPQNTQLYRIEAGSEQEPSIVRLPNAS